MDKWIILNKLIILVYSSLKYITLYEERNELMNENDNLKLSYNNMHSKNMEE